MNEEGTEAQPVIRGTGVDRSEWPELSEDMRWAAGAAPDHWFTMVDQLWDGTGSPPEWAVIGRWRSGPDGAMAEWQENPSYRPSPASLGWPEPSDAIERAVQLVCSGHGSLGAVIEALVAGDVTVPTDADGAPVFVVTPDGMKAVPVFSSAEPLQEGQEFRTVRVAALAASLVGGESLLVNADRAVTLRLGAELFPASPADSEG